jgi:hypothetical protein
MGWSGLVAPARGRWSRIDAAVADERSVLAMRKSLVLVSALTMMTAFAVGAVAMSYSAADVPDLRLGCGFPLPPCNPCPDGWTWYPEASMCCPPPGNPGPDCVQY